MKLSVRGSIIIKQPASSEVHAIILGGCSGVPGSAIGGAGRWHAC